MSASNIKSVQKTSSAAAVSGRTRLLGVYFTNTATASSVVLKDGGSSGTARLSLLTPASAGSQDLMIPDMGILFENGIYITFGSAEVTSVTLLFEGGAAA
jgi:hypothetical protein